MDDAQLVGRCESLRDLTRDRQRLLERYRAGGDPVGERRSLDQLQYQRGPPGKSATP